VTPLGPLARGVVAGVAGTTVMTAVQETVARLRGSADENGGPPTWDDAPAPAKVARKVLEGVFEAPQPTSRIPLLTNVMHWGYGTAWGAVYGVVQGTVRGRPLLHGPLFGAAVWVISYVQLVPMGLYQPPWEYDVETIGVDLSYHLAYGLGVAAAFDALDGAQ
jgi:hypothetical protein